MFRHLLFSLAALLFLSSSASAADKLVVASDTVWPPMELLDDQKNVIGYSTDYLKAVAKETGLNLEFRSIAWDGIFAGLAANQYDIIASSVTITPERQKVYDFTIPYYNVRQAIVVPKNVNCPDLASLKGKTVGGQIGTTGLTAVQQANVGAIIREYEDVGLAMQDLATGRVDSVVCDDPVALYYANQKADFADKLRVAFKTGDTEEYGFVVHKGRKDLVEKLNQGIKAVQAKGLDKPIAKKWLGE